MRDPEIERPEQINREILSLQRNLIRKALKGYDTRELEREFQTRVTMLRLPPIAIGDSTREVERC